MAVLQHLEYQQQIVEACPNQKLVFLIQVPLKQQKKDKRV